MGINNYRYTNLEMFVHRPCLGAFALKTSRHFGSPYIVQLWHRCSRRLFHRLNMFQGFRGISHLYKRNLQKRRLFQPVNWSISEGAPSLSYAWCSLRWIKRGKLVPVTVPPHPPRFPHSHGNKRDFPRKGAWDIERVSSLWHVSSPMWVSLFQGTPEKWERESGSDAVSVRVFFFKWKLKLNYFYLSLAWSVKKRDWTEHDV